MEDCVDDKCITKNTQADIDKGHDGLNIRKKILTNGLLYHKSSNLDTHDKFQTVDSVNDFITRPVPTNNLMPLKYPLDINKYIIKSPNIKGEVPAMINTIFTIDQLPNYDFINFKKYIISPLNHQLDQIQVNGDKTTYIKEKSKKRGLLSKLKFWKNRNNDKTSSVFNSECLKTDNGKMTKLKYIFHCLKTPTAQ